MIFLSKNDLLLWGLLMKTEMVERVAKSMKAKMHIYAQVFRGKGYYFITWYSPRKSLNMDFDELRSMMDDFEDEVREAATKLGLRTPKAVVDGQQFHAASKSIFPENMEADFVRLRKLGYRIS